MAQQAPSVRDSPFMWSKRLYAFIRYYGTDGITFGGTGTNINLALVDQITETEDAPKKIIDSINQHNQGAVAQPHRYSITIRVKENSRGMLALLWLLLNNRYFDVVIGPDPAANEDNSPEDDPWGPGDSSIYEACLVTRRSNTIVIDDVPVSTFSCIALRRNVSAIGGVRFGDGQWYADGDTNVAKYDNTEQIIPEA